MYPLRLPDDSAWRADPNYSYTVADALKAAYRQLRQASWQVGAFVAAFTCVRPFLDTPMARQQQLRVYYLMGMPEAAIGDYSTALTWLDDAILLAEWLDEAHALVDLLYARGAANRGLNRYGEAADDYEDSLTLFRDEKLFAPPWVRPSSWSC